MSSFAKTIKDMMLALNLKSKAFNVKYNLVYTYIFSDKKDCFYYVPSIIKYVDKHYELKQEFSGNTELFAFISKEIEKYKEKAQNK